MKKLPMILLVIVVTALAVLVTSFSSDRVSAAEPVCGPGGPGIHWVDNCNFVGPKKADIINPSTALVGIDLDGDCGRDVNLILTGPVTVNRQTTSDDSLNFPGASPVDGHPLGPGLDVIDTEIANMALTGLTNLGLVTLRVGKGTPGINPLVSNSFGAIVEQSPPPGAGGPTLADSFFDVFFEVEVDPPGPPPPFKLYNHPQLPDALGRTGLVLEAVIDRVPPLAVYFHPKPLCLDLFDAPDDPNTAVVEGNDTGINLVEARHDTKGTNNDPDLSINIDPDKDPTNGVTCTTKGPAKCTEFVGEFVNKPFTVNVVVKHIDGKGNFPNGYSGFQVRLDYSPGLILKNRFGTSEMSLWPDCVSAGEAKGPGNTYVGNCDTGPPPAQPSFYAKGQNSSGNTDPNASGIVMQVDFACQAPGPQTITLNHGVPLDSYLLDDVFTRFADPDPDETLTINCEVPVGGLVVDLDGDLGDMSLVTAQSSGSTGRLAGTIAGVGALAAVLTGAAWYARRRWAR